MFVKVSTARAWSLSGSKKKSNYRRTIVICARKNSGGRYTIVPFPRKNSDYREASEDSRQLIGANRAHAGSTVRLMPRAERQRASPAWMMDLIYDYPRKIRAIMLVREIGRMIKSSLATRVFLQLTRRFISAYSICELHQLEASRIYTGLDRRVISEYRPLIRSPYPILNYTDTSRLQLATRRHAEFSFVLFVIINQRNDRLIFLRVIYSSIYYVRRCLCYK